MEEHDYEEPLRLATGLVIAATQVHELYMAYVDVGFTEEQAMRLVEASITAQGSPRR